MLTFQHPIFRWNFFLPTLVVKILLDDDRERLTPFPAEREYARLWLTASFMPLSFNTIAQSTSCLGKKARWFPIASLVGFDMEFSFSSWWAACPIWYHTTLFSYIQPHDLPTYSKPGVMWDQSLHLSYNRGRRTHSTERCELWKGSGYGCTSMPLWTWMLGDGFFGGMPNLQQVLYATVGPFTSFCTQSDCCK